MSNKNLFWIFLEPLMNFVLQIIIQLHYGYQILILAIIVALIA